MRRSQGNYSRFVAYLKIGMPLVALLLLGTVFLVTSPDDFKGPGLVFTEQDRLALREGLHIVDPTISGATGNRDTYIFRARSMYNTPGNANLVTAETLSGEIAMGDGRAISIAGTIAELDISAETFHLSGGASLASSDGYTAETQGLIADLKAGTIVSEGPVVADGPAGHVEAGLLRISTNPKSAAGESENTVIWFGNGVKLLFEPNQK